MTQLWDILDEGIEFFFFLVFFNEGTGERRSEGRGEKEEDVVEIGRNKKLYSLSGTKSISKTRSLFHRQKVVTTLIGGTRIEMFLSWSLADLTFDSLRSPSFRDSTSDS